MLLARQRSLQREVAVKTLRPDRRSAAHVDSLLAESLLLSSLEHPNIVPVHLLLPDEQGLPLLVMKRIEGVSWATLIDEPEHPLWGQLTHRAGTTADRLEVHLGILGSVCNVLHFAHSREVIHRDVKPDNVMVGPFGEVYLVDWGLAQKVRPGAPAHDEPIVGTPGYMPPEMAFPGMYPQGPRTDVYLLGATLHYVLTGRQRHKSGTLGEMLGAARSSQPYSYGKEVSEELGVLCNRATAAEPARRPASAAEFREALLDYRRHREAIALCDAAMERLEQLQALVSPTSPSSGASASSLLDSTAIPSRLRELIIECQFGFQESLRLWPEYARAQVGLRDCRIAAIEYELSMENAVAARALLKKVDSPPEELRARVSALRQHVAEQKASAARLAEIVRGQDWSVAAAPRIALLVLSAGVAFLLWRLVTAQQGAAPHSISPGTLAGAMGAAFLWMVLLVLLFRRQLLATTVNRQGVLGLLCCLGGMVVNRGLHMLPAPSTSDILSVDQVLAATVAAVGGVVLARWLWLLVPVLLCGALGERLWPSEFGYGLIASGSTSLAIGLVFLRRSAGKTAGQEGVPKD